MEIEADGSAVISAYGAWMLGWFKKDERVQGAKRSSRWPAVRAAVIKKNPMCIACGRTVKLEVHHIQPFHKNPELELEESNCCVLCDDPCHLVHGHFLNYKLWNPDVVEQCRNYREGLRSARSRVV